MGVKLVWSGVAVAAIAGTGWMLFVSRTGTPGPFVLFGLVFIVFGVAAAISGNAKAGRFIDARQRHEATRAAVMTQLANQPQARRP